MNTPRDHHLSTMICTFPYTFLISFISSYCHPQSTASTALMWVKESSKIEIFTHWSQVKSSCSMAIMNRVCSFAHFLAVLEHVDPDVKTAAHLETIVLHEMVLLLPSLDPCKANRHTVFDFLSVHCYIEKVLLTDKSCNLNEELCNSDLKYIPNFYEGILCFSGGIRRYS